MFEFARCTFCLLIHHVYHLHPRVCKLSPIMSLPQVLFPRYSLSTSVADNGNKNNMCASQDLAMASPADLQGGYMRGNGTWRPGERRKPSRPTASLYSDGSLRHRHVDNRPVQVAVRRPRHCARVSSCGRGRHHYMRAPLASRVDPNVIQRHPVFSPCIR
ncbi:hypothetical protein BD310DRAFT_346301 [Dichomitus squalens]|uniref:Uncharacterized protein n=1 Tax=Dichomitus squalens TaxID=114155 RepID=A0A4Q9PZJ7_9APHY|nr:hypothetical protein BD310DRAFT_346301 [Dichomitus squalens]